MCYRFSFTIEFLSIFNDIALIFSGEYSIERTRRKTTKLITNAKRSLTGMTFTLLNNYCKSKSYTYINITLNFVIISKY